MTPEGRLYDAGFTRQLEWWVTPGDERVLSMDDAIEKLDSGEIKPGGPEISTLAPAARVSGDDSRGDRRDGGQHLPSASSASPFVAH
jgi:hypothetical protein